MLRDEPVCLRALVDQCWRAARRLTALPREVELTVRFQNHIDESSRVQVRRSFLCEILVQAFRNIRLHSFSVRSLNEVKISSSISAPNSFVLLIEDNGPGMDVTEEKPLGLLDLLEAVQQQHGIGRRVIQILSMALGGKVYPEVRQGGGVRLSISVGEDSLLA